MIVVTGAAGFIGSCLTQKLNLLNYGDLVLVDDFSNLEKNKNIATKSFSQKINRNEFFNWLDINGHEVDFIFHIGARTDTTEMDKTIFDQLNLNYTKKVWEKCVSHSISLVYASSAATYGDGKHGYDDKHEIIENLKPLNPYGESKNDFDKWALKQEKKPPFWVGLKFFNVYGPNEYHKGRMASVIFHAFNQIQNTGKVKLFASHNPNYEDGMQLRDFIYVKDLIDVCTFFLAKSAHSGIYNLGTGKADSFLQLAKSTFQAMQKEEKIEFIPTPIDIRDNYQYFTEANMQKLRQNGYLKPFMSLKEGVDDYVRNYLLEKVYF